MSKRTSVARAARHSQTARDDLGLVTIETARKLTKSMSLLLEMTMASHQREYEAYDLLMDVDVRAGLTPEEGARFEALMQGHEEAVTKTDEMMKRTMAKLGVR